MNGVRCESEIGFVTLLPVETLVSKIGARKGARRTDQSVRRHRRVSREHILTDRANDSEFPEVAFQKFDKQTLRLVEGRSS